MCTDSGWNLLREANPTPSHNAMCQPTHSKFLGRCASAPRPSYATHSEDMSNPARPTYTAPNSTPIHRTLSMLLMLRVG